MCVDGNLDMHIDVLYKSSEFSTFIYQIYCVALGLRNIYTIYYWFIYKDLNEELS